MDGKPKEQPRIRLQGMEQLEVERFIALHALQKRLRAMQSRIGPGRRSILTIHRNLPNRMFNPPWQEEGEPTRQKRRYVTRMLDKAVASKRKVEARRVARLNRSKRKQEKKATKH